MIRRRPPRPRWLVRCYALNHIAAGCGIPVEPLLLSATIFRWHWTARLWARINDALPAPGFMCWSEVERERPRLRVIEGGRVGRAA